MGTITIYNNTRGVLHVIVTATDDSGQQNPFDIQPGASESWSRTTSQVAFAFREDNGHMESFVVQPGLPAVVGPKVTW